MAVSPRHFALEMADAGAGLCMDCSISKKEWIFGIIVIVGVLQATWVLGQQIGYLESNHSLFPITGLLGNPGQLGGFQAVTFVSALLLLTEKFSRRKEKESPKYGFRVLVFSLSGAVHFIRKNHIGVTYSVLYFAEDLSFGFLQFPYYIQFAYPQL